MVVRKVLMMVALMDCEMAVNSVVRSDGLTVEWMVLTMDLSLAVQKEVM